MRQKIKHSLLVLLLSGFIAIAIPFASRAARQHFAPATATKPEQSLRHAVPGEILVRFRTFAPIAQSKADHAEMRILDAGRPISLQIERVSNGPEIVAGLRVARVAPEETAAAIKTLNSQPDVLYAEPNFIREKQAAPNDVRYVEQWALQNTGQIGVAGIDIKAEPAWDITTGSRSIVVGIVDEGIDINHPDLKDNIWSNPGEIAGNGIDDDGNGYVDDLHGWDFFHNDSSVFDGNGTFPTDPTDAHGTHVAGTVGAVGNNGLGVAGVNWQVSLLALKFLGPNGGSTADLLKALAYAKTMRDLWTSSGGARGANIKVLNNSYGGIGKSQAELDAINALAQSEILFVAAAGNDKLDNDRFPHYPANYSSPNLISVAATDSRDSLANFSDYGARTVHVFAPGSLILSTTPNGTYSTASGTSMASPHVAGAAALVCAANQNISMTRLRAAVLFGGDQIETASPFGYNVATARRLNLFGALQNATENDSTPPAAVSDLHVTSQSGRTINLAWSAPGEDGGVGRASMYELRFSDGDATNPGQFAAAFRLNVPLPAIAGTAETTSISIPVRHVGGTIGIRAIDNAGNAGPIAAVGVSVPVAVGDPVQISTGPAEPLSTGGTALGLVGDDKFFLEYQLPGNFRFVDSRYPVTVSTNGALYFNYKPLQSQYRGVDNDLLAATEWLGPERMVAGAWDDLRTDRRPGDDVYVVTPDPSRVIFRWQAVTHDRVISPGNNRGENPVNFEIELRQDGTIIIRYGEGNHNLMPVVGMSIGEAEGYGLSSHTSESAPVDLANAATVKFTPRVATPTPSPDISLTMISSPEVVLTSRQLTYSIQAIGSYGVAADQATIVDQLPAGTSFVSCSVTATNVSSCSGPPVGSGGTVTATLGDLLNVYPTVTIVVQVNAPPGALIVNTPTISSYWTDPNPSNNSVSISTEVLPVTDFSNAIAVSAGGDNNRGFTAALKADGTVWCWGDNTAGRLGMGSDSSFFASNLPLQVAGLSDVTAISAGKEHVLALKSDGTVWGWGSNSVGELGISDRVNRSTAVQVPGISGVVAIAAGFTHSMAIKSDGTLWHWGLAYFSHEPILEPIQVSGLSQIKGVSVGTGHYLVVRTDGTVWAWGSNVFGEGGQDTATNFLANPTQVAGLTNVKAVACGSGFSMALKQDGTLWAWGSSFYGNLGTAKSGGPTPNQVVIGNVVSVELGDRHSMAIKTDGTVWVWGDNSFGQLGLGPGDHSHVDLPVQVPGLTNALSITGSYWQSAAVLSDGTVRTWGGNHYGELGDSTNDDRRSPVIVSGLTRVVVSITPPSGNYSTVQYATISANPPDATIHYTLNNAEPTLSDPVFTPGSFVRIDKGLWLKAKAWKSGKAPGTAAALISVNLFPNPIDDPTKFVRQQYLDFLNREPDSGGQDYWISQLSACGNDWLCMHQKRIVVSAAFFIELEFQQSGSVVYRLNRAAYGTLANAPTRANVTYPQFIADRAQLVGGSGLAQSTIDLANAFVQRAAFKTEYPDAMTASEFVNHLFDKASLSGTANASLRQTEIAAMTNNGRTRAQVLLDVIDIQEFKDREYKPSFVLMQYFGYLRRDPDQGGYDFWLNVLNNRLPNDSSGYRSMVCAFLTSAEYQQRFGFSITRTNTDCN